MYIIVAIVGYFLGSIPTGYLVGKLLCGIDIRQFGSKNIGTTNMFRTLGPRPAAMVLIVDVLKGVAAVAFALYYADADIMAQIVAGVLSVIGHNYSCWLGFKGGRGVATSLGVVIMLMPMTSLLVFIIWAVIVYATRYVSLGSITGAACTPLLAWHFGYDEKIQILGVVMAVLVIAGHKDNIKRLLDGNENKIKAGSMDNLKK